MKKYYVLVQRVSSIQVPIEAESAEAAAEKADAKIINGDLIFDFDPADSYTEVVDVYDRNFTHVLSL